MSMDLRRWKKKQKMAQPSRFYGDGGTIHSAGHLDVETHEGRVVAVWYRCQMLPFEESVVDRWRAKAMNAAYAGKWIPTLTGVEVLDPE